MRFRSPDNIIEEMKMLIDKYKVDEFQFEDDNLTGWPKRAKELFEKMIPLKTKWCTPNGVKIDTIDEEMLKLMKKSGCYRITYAMESGNQEVLNKIIKKPYDLYKAKEIVKLTKKIGIEVHTYWIIGFPGETAQQMWDTFFYAKSLKTDSSSVCLATPMVGAELLKICEEQNLLREGFDVDTAPYTESWIKHPELKKEQLEWMCNHFNNKLNSGLFFRNPIRFLRKYGKTIRENPKNILNLFKKFS